MYKFIPIVLLSVFVLACPGSEGSSPGAVGNDTSSNGGGQDTSVSTVACGEVLHCSRDNNCSDSDNIGACVQACAVELGAASVGTWEAYAACSAEQCSFCDVDNEDCLGGCIFLNCTSEWFECMSHQTSGTADCAETFACNDACSDGDLHCLQDCVEKASVEGQAAYFPVLECFANSVANNGSGDECAELAVDCACSHFDAMQGTAECTEFLDCTDECEDDLCCFPECRSKLNEEAQAQSDVLMDCIFDKCSNCEDGDDECWGTCIGENCMESVWTCQCPDAPASGTGTADCSTAFECITDGCEGKGPCCAPTCLGEASPEAYEQLDAFFGCIQDCGCGDGEDFCWLQCLTAKCKDEREECGVSLGGLGGF
ncbi:MAG: hypothetical protein CMH54_10885 [Myxococcales bacterium]|nr:hypothetical protein [Myxococcales bacterium]